MSHKRTQSQNKNPAVLLSPQVRKSPHHGYQPVDPSTPHQATNRFKHLKQTSSPDVSFNKSLGYQNDEIAILKKPNKKTVFSQLQNIYEASEYSRKKANYILIFLALIAIFSIFRIALLSIFYINYLMQDSQEFTEMQGVLQTAGYCSVTKVITSFSHNSSPGVPLAFGVFPGTKEGCYHSGSAEVTSGSCGGDTVAALPEKSLYEWKNIDFYAEYANVKMAKYCEDGYVRCGRTSFFCVQGTGCGVSDVQLFTNMPSASTPSGYTEVQFSSSVSLFYYVDPTIDNLLYKMTTQSNSPCLSENMYPQRKNEAASHPLEKIARDGCGTYGNNLEISKLDSTTEDNLYSDNSVNYASVPKFAKYVVNKPVYLSAVFMPKLNGKATFDSCGDVYKVCTFTGQVKDLNKKINFLEAVLCYFEIIGFILLILHWVLSIKMTKYPIKDFRWRLSVLVGLFVEILMVVGLIIGGILLFKDAYKIEGESFSSQFDLITETRCFVMETINSAFVDFQSYIKNIKKVGYAVIVVCGSSILQGVILTILHFKITKIQTTIRQLELPKNQT